MTGGLEGRIAIVLGGAREIGEAVVGILGREGEIAVHLPGVGSAALPEIGAEVNVGWDDGDARCLDAA